MESADVLIELMKQAGYNARNMKSMVNTTHLEYLNDVVLIKKPAGRYLINAIFDGSIVIFRYPKDPECCESFDLCDPDSFHKITRHVKICLKFKGKNCSVHCPNLK